MTKQHVQRWLGAVIVLAVLFMTMGGVLPGRVRNASAGAAYYVDCQNGNDSNNGTGPGQAWRSLAKANEAPLRPGDSLLFLRGCTWTGTLHAAWRGTAANPITIGAYGSGARPRIHNGPTDLANAYHNNVEITGAYQVIDSIETTIVNPPVHTGCQNNPLGFFIGFNFRNPDNTPDGGSHNVLRNSRATAHTAGVHTNSNTHHNRILNSEFVANRAMEKLTPTTVGTTDDIGAWGILLKGNNHEVAYNWFMDNRALCTFDTPPQGNAVELYEAQNNNIHHNRSFNDRDFSELGGSAVLRSADNTFAYNLVVSNVDDAHFIITRGSGNHFGPVYGTRLFNNTIYYTGANSEGIICGANCGTEILTARNNIIWAEKKAIFGDAPFHESHNVYWSSTGDPVVQLMGSQMNASSHVANPRFVNTTARNFRLQQSSPAIDNGSPEPLSNGYIHDLAGVALPLNGAVERGAFEYIFGVTGTETVVLPVIMSPAP